MQEENEFRNKVFTQSKLIRFFTGGITFAIAFGVLQALISGGYTDYLIDWIEGIPFGFLFAWAAIIIVTGILGSLASLGLSIQTTEPKKHILAATFSFMISLGYGGPAFIILILVLDAILLFSTGYYYSRTYTPLMIVLQTIPSQLYTSFIALNLGGLLGILYGSVLYVKKTRAILRSALLGAIGFALGGLLMELIAPIGFSLGNFDEIQIEGVSFTSRLAGSLVFGFMGGAFLSFASGDKNISGSIQHETVSHD